MFSLFHRHQSVPKTGRPKRPIWKPSLEALENRTLLSLSTSYTLSGHVGAEVAAFAALDAASFSGTLTLNTIPTGAAIEWAGLYAINYFGPETPSATFAGTPLGTASVYDTQNELTVYKWDVASLITGNGGYTASATGFEYSYGFQLVVVFSEGSLPEAEVIVNDGANDVGTEHTTGKGSTSFTAAAAGAGQLWIGTGADDTSTSSETIVFNGAVVGGPIDANLGSSASLFLLDVAVEAGANAATINTFGDWMGWNLAVLVRNAGAQVDINNTAARGDDITLYNPIPLIGAFTQTVPVKITNTGLVAVTFQLIVTPAHGTLSQAAVTLNAGANTSVTFTPIQVSAAVDDVTIEARIAGVLAGSQRLTIVSVVLPNNVRRANTPAGMADRIPTRVDTTFNVTVTPDLAGSGRNVTLAVNGQSAANGTVTIDGGFTTLDITTTANVNLRGSTFQTATGGNQGNLRFVVRVRGEDTTQSAGFSVSVIPVNFRQTAVRRPGGGVLEFDYAWDADSDTLADLNQVWVGEHVQAPSGGILPQPPWRSNIPAVTILPARAPGGLAVVGMLTDEHYPPGRMLPAAGPAHDFTTTQNYGFHDFRTDPRPVDATLGWQVNFGASIPIQRFVEMVAGAWRYRITKSGETATAAL